jgi:hypothetical protein
VRSEGFYVNEKFTDTIWNFLLPTYFYSGILRTFQHICNSYCQHHSCSQNVHSTRTLSLPHTTVPFGPPLSCTLYSYNSHTFPASTLHTTKECKGRIEPATFRFVAYHLNHCVTTVVGNKNYKNCRRNN